jgi:hypothetical protein
MVLTDPGICLKIRLIFLVYEIVFVLYISMYDQTVVLVENMIKLFDLIWILLGKSTKSTRFSITSRS